MRKDLTKAGLSIVRKCGSAITGSVDNGGFPDLKTTLKPRENDGLRTFFFPTRTSSVSVQRYLKNSRASLYFFDGESLRGLMLTGSMEVLTDRNTRKRIWRDTDSELYPGGWSDPEFCILKFTTGNCRLFEEFKSWDFGMGRQDSGRANP